MIRPATPADVPVLLELVRALAEYEHLLHTVRIDAARLDRDLFGLRPYAEALVAEDVTETEGSRVAGFALFFHNYSTFLGQPGLYLEDLYIRAACRRRGHGQALLVALARIAIDRNCGRLEWAALKWNAPALAFYRSLGAEVLTEWNLLRLTGPALGTLAQSGKPSEIVAGGLPVPPDDGLVAPDHG